MTENNEKDTIFCEHCEIDRGSRDWHFSIGNERNIWLCVVCARNIASCVTLYSIERAIAEGVQKGMMWKDVKCNR